MANSNLYPPIVAYSMPAFAIENSTNTRAVGSTVVRIYFALSSYNSRNNFKKVHLTVRYQQNNSNALNMDSSRKPYYPAQIKICDVFEVNPEENNNEASRIASTQYKYYVELYNSDLAEGFQPDLTYKIQLRLADDQGPADGIATIAYFNNAQNLFSEWSSVCLIRGIVPPKFFVIGLEDSESEDTTFDTELIYASIDANFTVSYTPGSKEETLKQWRIQLLDKDKNLLSDSGIIAFNNYDNILYEDNGSFSFDTKLPYQMDLDTKYYIVIWIETKNGYTTTKTRLFTTTANNTGELPATVSAYIVEEDGYAVVEIVGTDGQKQTMNITLCRSTADSDFKQWDDIANITVVDEVIDWSYCDFTIESGTYYRYAAQIRDIRGRRGTRQLSDPVMGEFEDAFLVERGESLSNAKQLKLRYDFKVNTFTRTVSESKTDTIGSQYPYVRRNGNMYYRELQCTGLITGFMDNHDLFASDLEIYHNVDNVQRYNQIRQAINMKVNQYDYTYEREFREAVESFLLNSKVKLFKSLQEGNMLVKLMNISFTPRQGLNRLIYDFTATFVEVDEINIETLNKYGLMTTGYYQSSISWGDDNILGRIVDSNQISAAEQEGDVIPTLTINANQDIMDLIKSKYNVGQNAINGILTDDVYLTHLRLEMESEPYLINIKNNPPTVVDDKNNKVYNEAGYTVGWLIKINDETILLQPPNHIYELKGVDVYLPSSTKIIPLATTQMQIDFVANLIKSQDVAKVPVRQTYRKINGQYIKQFEGSENIINTLWYKYYIDYFSDNPEVMNDDQEDYYEQIIKVFSLDVEAEPGAIIKARSSAFPKDALSTMIVGETGRLLVDPGSTEFSLDEMYITGMRVDARYLLNKYDLRGYNEALVETSGYNGSTLKEFNDKHNCGSSIPDKPKLYDYYIDNLEDKTGQMFYRGAWYSVQVTQINGYNTIFDITCPVDAIIFYFVQAEKGYYG